MQVEEHIALIPVLVLLIRVDQGKVAGLQGLFLPLFNHNCATAFN